MLDEDVVKRGVSDRKMRSLPEQPGLSLPSVYPWNISHVEITAHGVSPVSHRCTREGKASSNRVCASGALYGLPFVMVM